MTSEQLRVASWLAHYGTLAGFVFGLAAILSTQLEWLTLLNLGMGIALLSTVIGFVITKMADRLEAEHDC